MNKRIFIHIGPPKTGTSAIQYWLSQNKQFLNENKVFYPIHEVDVNGVSSGNLDTIYDRNKSKQLVLNQSKVEKLIEDFEKSDCSALLLSSEFLFSRCEELKSAFPSATFIAYVRNPIEVIESSYNQGVKRHFQVEKLKIAKPYKMTQLESLISIKHNILGDALILRYYGKDFFYNNNIVSDLLSILGIEANVEINKVNHSYQFEVLEFKRWLNNYPLGIYQHKVDGALQSYKGGTDRYSLLSSQVFKNATKAYIKYLSTAEISGQLDKLDDFVNSLKNKRQSAVLKQELSIEKFDSVVTFLKEKLKQEFPNLCLVIHNHPIKDMEDYESHFTKDFPKRFFEDGPFLKLKKALKRRLESKSEKKQTATSFEFDEDLKGIDALRKKLKIADNIQDAEILRELAFFMERNGSIEVAVAYMQKAHELKPDGKLIKQKLLQYKNWIEAENQKNA